MQTDVTAPDRSGRELDLARTMIRLADTLGRDFDPLELFRDLVESSARILAVDAAAVSLRDGGGLGVIATTSEDARLIELVQTEHAEGPCIDTFSSGRHVGASDLSACTARWPRWAARAIELGFHSADGFPLRLGDQCIGALDVYGRRPCSLSAQDRAVAESLVEMATIGLVHERIVDDHKTVREQLRHALDSRVVIEQAKGIVAERHQVGMAEAFEAIRDRSRSTRTRLVRIARDVVEGRLDIAPR